MVEIVLVDFVCGVCRSCGRGGMARENLVVAFITMRCNYDFWVNTVNEEYHGSARSDCVLIAVVECDGRVSVAARKKHGEGMSRQSTNKILNLETE